MRKGENNYAGKNSTRRKALSFLTAFWASISSRAPLFSTSHSWWYHPNCVSFVLDGWLNRLFLWQRQSSFTSVQSLSLPIINHNLCREEGEEIKNKNKNKIQQILGHNRSQAQKVLSPERFKRRNKLESLTEVGQCTTLRLIASHLITPRLITSRLITPRLITSRLITVRLITQTTGEAC